ncbi:MAG: BrnT family toxin [Aestuariivirga sp.]
MDISYDPTKHQRNLNERGLGFNRDAEFDFATALFAVDARKDYGETRWRGLGLVVGRIHALVFVETKTGIRVISFRKANAREVKHYEEESAKRRK